MKTFLLCCGFLFSLLSLQAHAEGEGSEEMKTEEKALTPQQKAKGEQAFLDVYSVLQHPRCLNCHPKGNLPLQGENSIPHVMNIGRQSTEAGLECSGCHQLKNAEEYGLEGGVPGAPNWHLPKKEIPLIFEGRSPTELCEQLKNPKENGNLSMVQLLEHISLDPLVLWGWKPGGDRTPPPLSHSEFMKQFALWVELGGPCPPEK